MVKVYEPSRSKSEWRARARANRRDLRIDHGRVCQGLKNFLPKAPAGFIVTYNAMADEVDLASILDDATLGPFAVTRTPTEGGELTLHPIASPTERHRFGFDQPIATSPKVPLEEVAVVLVPGLAFTVDGARLGQGAGYYDRFLASLPAGALRIGISDGFIVSGLPVEVHDMPMTHLAGEMGVVSCR